MAIWTESVIKNCLIAGPFVGQTAAPPPAACPSDLAVCQAETYNLTLSLANLTKQYDLCTCAPPPSDPCDGGGTVAATYGWGLHIAAVFIILVASLAGTAIPVVLKHARWRYGKFCIACGKCMGTGVVLACGFIHMLQPSSVSLTSPCVPWEFNTDYTAYSFLYAMLAGLLMQWLDWAAMEFVESRMQHAECNNNGGSSLEMEASTAHHDGHSHQLLKYTGSTRKAVEAIMIEFGVTLHSLFIGLATGVVDISTLVVLLTALCFHQFFEGVALGARLADANFPHIYDAIFAIVFSVAAPIGLAIGIGIHTFNPDGETFLMVQGTFDGVCGGILIYLGYCLLLLDFPHDMRANCQGEKHTWLMKGLMFSSLWLGAGLMAFIGKYL